MDAVALKCAFKRLLCLIHFGAAVKQALGHILLARQ
jgi:hypothetical protein